MKTIVLRIRDGDDPRDVLNRAAAIIATGGTVAFPTETVYGLGANAFDEAAVKQIFRAKGRPADDPLIVHVASQVMLDTVTVIPPASRDMVHCLGERFWPGALTLVLPRHDDIPDIVTSGLPTVAVRIPAHPIARAFIEACAVPIAAPSANRFEHASPTRAAHVIADLNGRIDAIIDAGQATIGVESTILDLTTSPPVVLRPGGVSVEALQDVIGPVTMHPSVKNTCEVDVILAPGMKARHYAPDASLVLVEGDPARAGEAIKALASQSMSAGKRTGIILTGGSIDVPGATILQLGDDPASIARELYNALRQLDDLGVDLIIAGSTTEEGLGLAIMNRLRKAAREIVHV